jgi:colanic acid/amylovoran biosynthesis glycosyltransferase
MSIHILVAGLMWPPEPFILTRLERLTARGFRVTVAAHVSPEGRAFRRSGIDVVPLPPTKPPRLRALLAATGGLVRLAVQSPARARRLLAALRRPEIEPPSRTFWAGVRRLHRLLALAALRPDVVHLEWESAAVAFHPLVDVWRRPTVVGCHGSGVNIYAYMSSLGHFTRGYATVFARATAIHCVSEATRAAAVGLGADPAKTRLIRPAVDGSLFRPSDGGASRSFRVVSVAELRWAKGYEYALRAIALLAAEGVPVSFVLVGGEPPALTPGRSDTARLRYTAEDLGISDRFELRGEASLDEVAATLRAADVFLHPSLSEGLPNAVLEAMASGLPVVVTDAGGTREAVRDGREGLLVAPRDPKATAAALMRLWRDPDLRARLGAAGRARVLEEFTLERQDVLWTDLYAEVVAA